MGRGVQVVNHWKTAPHSGQEDPFSSLPPAQSVRNMPQRQGSNLEGSLRQKMFHQARSKTTLGPSSHRTPSNFGSTMSLLTHPQSETSVLETINDSAKILKCSKESSKNTDSHHCRTPESLKVFFIEVGTTLQAMMNAEFSQKGFGPY